ncbi:hypothetical protein CS060_05245 [Anoxybacillus flavithermus]|uniref:Uncharacterized protein n=1 Tax=Anoxybacillus flavithermus TaxID=33934 RepID=A0A2G5RRH0_9BACL|nr:MULTISPECIES: hypothetical protein [Anoxybacillus]KFZ42967.1 hypothetical protein JS80_06390 [Anoxybacillus sp. KU2-6(11)]PIC05279.1 hypothetical protein CS060_05245 [Anoxybacillus flavithermus]
MKNILLSIFLLFILSNLAPINNQVYAEENNDIRKFVELKESDVFTPMTDEELDKIRDSDEDYHVELTYEQAVERTAEITGKSVEQVSIKYKATCGCVLDAIICSSCHRVSFSGD